MCWWTAIDNSMKPVKGQMRLGRLQGFRVNPCSALKPRHTQNPTKWVPDSVSAVPGYSTVPECPSAERAAARPRLLLPGE